MRFTSVKFGSVKFDNVKFGNMKFDDMKFGDVKFSDMRFDDMRFDGMRFIIDVTIEVTVVKLTAKELIVAEVADILKKMYLLLFFLRNC